MSWRKATQTKGKQRTWDQIKECCCLQDKSYNPKKRNHRPIFSKWHQIQCKIPIWNPSDPPAEEHWSDPKRNLRRRPAMLVSTICFIHSLPILFRTEKELQGREGRRPLKWGILSLIRKTKNLISEISSFRWFHFRRLLRVSPEIQGIAQLTLKVDAVSSRKPLDRKAERERGDNRGGFHFHPTRFSFLSIQFRLIQVWESEREPL